MTVLGASSPRESALGRNPSTGPACVIWPAYSCVPELELDRAARFARAISAHHREQCPSRSSHVVTIPGEGAVRVPGCGCRRERLLFTELYRSENERCE